MFLARLGLLLLSFLATAHAGDLRVNVAPGGPELVYPRVCAAAIVDRGILLVAGGRHVGIGNFNLFETYSGDSAKFVAEGVIANTEVSEILRTTGGSLFFLGARPLHHHLQVPFRRAISGQWDPTPHPIYRREWNTVTALSDDRVFVVGGKNGVRLNAGANTPWIYPLEGETASAPDFADWKLTAPMKKDRALHSAALTKINGEEAVLVAGGVAENFQIHQSTELYFPKRDVWESSGDLLNPRRCHSATALPDGRVVILGGEDSEYSIHRVELFDPKTRTFSEIGNLKTSRRGHTTTLLSFEGRPILIVVGGFEIKPGNKGGTTSSIEIVDVDRNEVYEAGRLNQARWNHFAVAQNKNQILVGGGVFYHGGFTSTEVLTLQLSK